MFDGVLSASGGACSAVASSSLWIGSAFGSRYWNGLIDDVRVYNRALSAAEVMALYNAEE